MLATFIVILNETVMINAIPRLMVEFDVSTRSAQWLTSGFMLTMAVVIPITGWFLQRVTTRQGASELAASVGGNQWGFGVGAVLAVVVVAIALVMPGRLPSYDAEVRERDEGPH